MPTLQVPGATLHYEDAGGTGSPVVFLHPASGSAASWENQLPVFREHGYRCITYDLRGWGRSQPNADSVDSGCMSDDLGALVDTLDLARFSLIGAAYGGFGALDYALRLPERLLALVLSGTQAGIADPMYVAVRERVVSPPIRALPVELRELGPSYRTRDPAGVERWIAVAKASDEPSAAARQRMAVQITLPLSELRVPTLLIAGGADLLAPPELMRLYGAGIPSHRLVVFGEAGHCVHWEQPEDWNREVLAFLDEPRT